MAQQPVLNIQQVTAADRLKLIDLISKRQMIWDSNIVKTNDQAQTEWQNISQLLSTPGRKFDVDLIKKVWSYLRGNYTKSVKDIHSSWQYLKPLSFLKPSLKAKEAAKFVVNVSDGSVSVQAICNKQRSKHRHFYKIVRKEFPVDEAIPFTVSTGSNRVIPNSTNYKMGDFGILNGEFLKITAGVGSTGNLIRRTFRDQLEFSSVEEAKKYRTIRNFGNDYVFSVYLIVERVIPSQATALKIDSDFFKLAIKCGTSQRKDIKQILIASCTNEEARAIGFSSSETWGYGLELAFGELVNLFGKDWRGGVRGCAFNKLCQQEAAGKFTFEWCYATLLGLIKKSVQEDLERAKFSAFRAELRSELVTYYQRLSELMRRFT